MNNPTYDDQDYVSPEDEELAGEIFTRMMDTAIGNLKGGLSPENVIKLNEMPRHKQERVVTKLADKGAMKWKIK